MLPRDLLECISADLPIHPHHQILFNSAGWLSRPPSLPTIHPPISPTGLERVMAASAADTSPDPASAPISVGSNDTALCIIPPTHLWSSVDQLRMLYDKAYEKWPPHVNLVYPFVRPDCLPRAAHAISSHLASQDAAGAQSALPLSLEHADVFPHRHSNTIFIHDGSDGRASQLHQLRSQVFRALGQQPTQYRHHMTVGQSEDLQDSRHKFLLEKVSRIPPVEWEVEELSILVREKDSTERNSPSRMKLWGTISLRDYSFHPLAQPRGFYSTLDGPDGSEDDETKIPVEGHTLTRLPLCFSLERAAWEPYVASTEEGEEALPEVFKVSNYNVLAEFEYPPSQTRYPLILRNMLEQSALADVLVLEEVTDDFLCYLLRDGDLRSQYPFVTHGPPDQTDLDPLPSHLNVIVLSRWSFTWNYISFQRKHKGSVVLQFDGIGRQIDDTFFPTILATAHLTCGLTDGAVTAKKSELQSILNYLSQTYPQNSWILAGDFNITTSAYTIRAALEKEAISVQTARYLARMEKMLSESGLLDTWTMARLQNVDSEQLDENQHHIAESFEGEQGATFDPTSNELASSIVGSGLNNRPQRYDRILVKDADFFSISGFNMFGKNKETIENHQADTAPDTPDALEGSAQVTYASDHWGIRSSLKLISDSQAQAETDLSSLIVPVETKLAPESLSDASQLRKCLSQLDVFPSDADIAQREEALAVLQDALLNTETGAGTSEDRLKMNFVIVPVGSYGLGVWTSSSDVDCLCIGPISSRVFFTLAAQRLRKAAARGIKVLRRVDAHSGTMLELEVQGVKMDLQYCPSTLIADTWPRAMGVPANSPFWGLPMQTLSKLKPVRDLYYLRRTVPDLAAFRTAHYLIKTWAKQRGVYSARFGYLGGIHISVLLSRVCKLLTNDGGVVSVPTIITTFFQHYANFDWKNKMAFDPFFHKRLRYVRTSREPMAILGFHSPALNTAHAASTPSVRTLTEELQRADKWLSTEGATWSDFLDNTDTGPVKGSQAFLGAYKSYVRIEAQFWGVSLSKGSQFVSWLESRCVMLLVGRFCTRRIDVVGWG